MMRLVGLLGISGVGKSTLLKKLSDPLSFQHLQASTLIKEGRQIAESVAVSIDNLRNANIDENQHFLTSGFLKAVDPKAEIVILDGHSVIDTPSGLVPIEATVFAKLGITKIIFLADDPTEIFSRRSGDSSRGRPERTIDELRQYQDAAILNACKICLELGVPLIVVSPSQQGYISHVLSSS